jgi:hypothetical protein
MADSRFFSAARGLPRLTGVAPGDSRSHRIPGVRRCDRRSLAA